MSVCRSVHKLRDGYQSPQVSAPVRMTATAALEPVVPGRFAIAAFSPRLNEAGNSVRAQKAIRYIAGKLGVGLFGPNGDVQ